MADTDNTVAMEPEKTKESAPVEKATEEETTEKATEETKTTEETTEKATEETTEETTEEKEATEETTEETTEKATTEETAAMDEAEGEGEAKEAEGEGEAKEAEKEEEAEEEKKEVGTPGRRSGRSRKTVQQFTIEEPKAKNTEVEIPEGEGTALGEMENVKTMIDKRVAMTLKFVHKLCFGTQGLKKNIKANLRKFTGYSNDKQATTAQAQLDKMEKKKLKVLAELFCLETSGNKDEMIERILDWLKKPKDTGRAPTTGRKASKKKAPKKKKSTKKRKKKTDGPKRTANGYMCYAASVRQKIAKENEGMVVSEIAKIIGEQWREMDDDDKAPFQEQAADLKAASLEAYEKSGGSKKKQPPKKKAKKAKKEESSEEEEDSDESDDEPLEKKRKSGLTLAMENLIKEIMAKTPLEDLSVKKIRNKLKETFSEDTVATRKGEIKAFIQEIADSA